MTQEHRTVAARNSDGKLCVCGVEATWPSTTLQGSQLIRSGHRWLVLDDVAQLLGEPARVVTDDEALDWLVLNGYPPPAELRGHEVKRRLD